MTIVVRPPIEKPKWKSGVELQICGQPARPHVQGVEASVALWANAIGNGLTFTSRVNPSCPPFSDVNTRTYTPVNEWIEFASWNEKFATEAVAPILNKVGAFVANPMVRNIIGQPKSTFNVRKIMDEGKILIVNLSKGLMGEDNAAIMGALMVTKIQLSAMSRADIPRVEDRTPFYLYVDEFQNFATDSFAVILSEARKYGLNLTVANQYISQMPPEVKDAVFGNVGSMVVFRVGAEDGSSLSKYFEPFFESQDILQQNNRHFMATMAIDGEKIS